jgi:hypothetical protein
LREKEDSARDTADCSIVCGAAAAERRLALGLTRLEVRWRIDRSTRRWYPMPHIEQIGS